MDIIELMGEKEKLDAINYKNNRELIELVSQLTYKSVNTRILTPIYFKDSNRWRIGIDKGGIKEWESSIVPNSETLNCIELKKYQSIDWIELVDWIKNYTNLDSNIFYQIGNAIYNYNLRPVEIFYYLDEEDNKKLNIDRIAVGKYSISIGEIDIYENILLSQNNTSKLPDKIWFQILSKNRKNQEYLEEYRNIFFDKIWDLLLNAITEYNKKLEQQNESNKRVIENLKNELSWKLVLDEI